MEVNIKDIRVPEGRRPLDHAKVAEIAASIKAVGLLSPIGIRRHGDAPVELVWGGHRVAACASLGMKTIEAVAVDGLGWDHGHREDADLDDFVKMTEIAENLHRADLTTQQRNEQLALWVELLERQKPNSDAEQPNSKPGPKPSLAVAAAAKMSGLTAKTVKEAIKSTKVSPEVKVAADKAELTSKQRLAVARLTDEDQQLGAIAAFAASAAENRFAASDTRPPTDQTKYDDVRENRATLNQLQTFLKVFLALEKCGDAAQVADAVVLLDVDEETLPRLRRVAAFVTGVVNNINIDRLAARHERAG